MDKNNIPRAVFMYYGKDDGKELWLNCSSVGTVASLEEISSISVYGTFFS